MTLAYVTAALPYGPSETFAIAEIEALRALGHTVHVLPLRRLSPIVHTDASSLASPPLDARVRERAAALGVGARLAPHARTARIAVKNAAALWVGAGLARRLAALRVEHVHAYWASTPATVAMAAAARLGIGWSLTAHLWDLYEDNLLGEKLRSVSFARAISSAGAAHLRQVCPAARVERVYVGVRLPPVTAPASASDGSQGRPLRVIVAANLLPKKGHAVLLDAAEQAEAGGVSLTVTCVGDGPLRSSLTEESERRRLPVEFAGRRSHAEVLANLAAGAFDVAALPSLVVPPSRHAPGGAFEGIPVFLMEAMAGGVPVVSTESGSIAELVVPGTGVLVPPGDAATLAAALVRLARDPSLRVRLAESGRARIEAAFRAETTAAQMAALFANACPPPSSNWSELPR